MGQQIKFFEKNVLDISNSDATLTASEGQSYVDFVRNRNNISAWVTSGSLDANLTNIVIDFLENRTLTDIILIKHNFKSYTIKYWDGSYYVDFSTVISVSANTSASTSHSFNSINTSKIKLVINTTMILNDDKYLFQLIATKSIGQFQGYPIISGTQVDRNRVMTPMLSGKKSIIENIGGVVFGLSVPHWRIPADISIIEDLYSTSDGFLVWPCGGDESQFMAATNIYRKEDIFLMKCSNEYSPDYAQGIYTNGLDLKIKLDEVVD